MKKFKCMKDLDQLQKDAIDQGWEVDMTEFKKGSDWVWLRDMDGRVLQVAVNCFGRFMVFSPESTTPIATERSEELDNEKCDIKNQFYCIVK